MVPDLVTLDAKNKATSIITPKDVVVLLGAALLALPELTAAMHEEQQAQQPGRCCEC